MGDATSNRKPMIAFLAIGAMILGGWYFMSQPRTSAAIDESVDAYVPSSATVKQGVDNIEQARQVTDLINARQSFPGNESR
jgi:hypothetical protein